MVSTGSGDKSHDGDESQEVLCMPGGDDWRAETRSEYKSRGIGERAGTGIKPALLIVDMQRAFTDPSCRLGMDQTPTVEAIGRLLKVARYVDPGLLFDDNISTRSCRRGNNG